MAGEEIKIPIGIPVETNAAEAADSVESLRDRITGASGDIKAMSGTLRQLRGTSDEVKAAKAQLTAKVDALRNSVSAASLALVKQGTTYDAAAAKEKKFLEQKKKLQETLKKDGMAAAKDRTSAMGAAIGHAGGPVAALKGKLDALKGVMGESSGATGLLTLGAAGLVAAVAVLVVGVVAAGVALSKFILTNANAARSANLLREAWSGTGKNASNLGTQIDALANKVPTSKAALNDLGISLMKLRMPGQATVDAFNAIGQASAALGDEAGGKIKEFLTQGRKFNSFRLTQADMVEGFGNLAFNDVAGALAKNLGIGIDAAKAKLHAGKVTIAQGAKAMRDATERVFGDLNLRKMMSLEVLSEKLHEKWEALTSGVNLEPLLKPLAELGKLFDSSTVTGATLKMLVTEFGKGMVASLVKAIPIAKALFQGLVIGALYSYIAFLKVRNALKETFGDSKVLDGVDGMKLALEAGKYAAIGIAGAIVLIGAVMAAGMIPMAAFVGLLVGLPMLSAKIGLSVRKSFDSIDWKATGTAIIGGIVKGLLAGPEAIVDAVTGVAGVIKKTFTNVLKIRSPSKEMFSLAKQVPAGVVGGIEAGTPAVAGASSAMAEQSKGDIGGSSSAAAGGSPIALHVHIHTGGASGASASAATVVSSPGFLAQLTKAVEDLLVSQGIPVQA